MRNPLPQGALGSKRILLLTMAGATMLAPASSHAQTKPLSPDGLALNRFDPAPAGDRLFGVPSPFAAGHLTPHVMLLGDYARDPLVLRRERDGHVLGAVVADQLTLHLNATLPLWDRVAVNVDAPLTVLQSGDDPNGGGQAFASPSAVEAGDLRLGARAVLYGRYYDPLQVAISTYLWVPTGAKRSFVSDGTVRALPQLIAGGRLTRFVWSVAVGPEIRRSQSFAGTAQGTMLTLGGGLGWLAAEDRLQVGPEITTAMVLKDVNKRSVNAEILLDARYRFLPSLEAGIGVGPGLTAGIGTPDLRAMAMAAFTPEPPRPPPDRDDDGIIDANDACPLTAGVPSTDPKKNGCPPPPDRDKDGIVDADDACPFVAGVPDKDPKKNGCPPPPDRDKDGIADADDACPFVAGVPDKDPKKNGCPPDRDDDGVPDSEDACPDLRGVATKDPATNGCPPDSDGDGLRDDKDACPHEKGLPDEDPTKNGCPKAVRVTEKEVVILQQVQFDTDRATIKPVSDPLLDEVAEVLKEHPEITRIEVQGHTDDRGTRDHNQVLSQSRANAVMQALVKRGIAASRLTARGYGQDQPLVDNTNEANRQKNRRVQFTIVDKATQDPQPGSGEVR